MAAIGLIGAVDRFDPSRGIAFTSFALPTIVGEIKRYFRDRTWMVRPPRSLQDNVLRLEHATTQFTTQHGRAPTVSEVAVRVEGMDEEDVLEALQVRWETATRSLDAPAGRGDDLDHSLADGVAAGDDGFAGAEQRVLIDDLLRAVTPRQREALRMRYVDDMTQAEIGEVIGVSQMQVSRILREAIARMQAAAHDARSGDTHAA